VYFDESLYIMMAESQIESDSQRIKSLSTIASETLRQCSTSLGDIGDVPLHLLGPILMTCSPDTLLRIEKETENGVSKRLVSRDLWPIWYGHVKEVLATTLKKNEVLKGLTGSKDTVNTDSPLRYLVDASVVPLDYKEVYVKVQERKRDRLAAAGKELRAKFQGIEQDRLSRHAKVIDHTDVISMRQSKGNKVTRRTTSAQSLSRKLGIRPVQKPTMRSTAFKRAQRALIKQHRSQDRKRPPTVGQLVFQRQNGASQKPSSAKSSSSLCQAPASVL
jgi:hypothetical protein